MPALSTAKSSFPSPFKSPRATEVGLFTTPLPNSALPGSETESGNMPLPLLSKTETLLLP